MLSLSAAACAYSLNAPVSHHVVAPRSGRPVLAMSPKEMGQSAAVAAALAATLATSQGAFAAEPGRVRGRAVGVQHSAAQRTRAARLPMSASSLSKSMPTGEGQKRWWKRPDAFSEMMVTACRVQKEASWRRATY
jgi:hypothetical protein